MIRNEFGINIKFDKLLHRPYSKLSNLKVTLCLSLSIFFPWHSSYSKHTSDTLHTIYYSVMIVYICTSQISSLLLTMPISWISKILVLPSPLRPEFLHTPTSNHCFDNRYQGITWCTHLRLTAINDGMQDVHPPRYCMLIEEWQW